MPCTVTDQHRVGRCGATDPAAGTIPVVVDAETEESADGETQVAKQTNTEADATQPLNDDAENELGDSQN